ncbi:MAG: HupE/UreJ family protein [Pseudomonadales bacterium]|nr:HupE/UreJ family protein [Pseudomonadales bacterium]
MRARLLLLCALLLFGYPAQAHEMRPSYIELVETAPGEYDVRFRQPVGQGGLQQELQTGCEAVSGKLPLRTQSTLTQQWRIVCEETEMPTLSVTGIEQSISDTIVRVTRQDGGVAEYTLSAAEPVLSLATRATPGLPVYLELGVKHLLFGFDHVLFVIGLMMLIDRPWRLVQTITSFTLAHSITLALSTLNIVQLSPAPVEAAIALSILYVAVEIAAGPSRDGITRRFPWVISFAFGLLHGFGFAGVLREIGLPPEAAGWALLLFNVGIEVGQIMIISVVLLVALTVRRVVPASLDTRMLRLVPAYLIGTVSVWWMAGRLATMLWIA